MVAVALVVLALSNMFLIIVLRSLTQVTIELIRHVDELRAEARASPFGLG